MYDNESSRNPVAHVSNNADDYTDPDQEVASPPPYQQVAANPAPPVPPRARVSEGVGH